MATTEQFIKAKSDPDLFNRLVAQAEMMGVGNAHSWVSGHLPLLLSEEIEAGQSIADVFAYASETRAIYLNATPPPPGQNLSAVTDTHMETAIQSVLNLATE